MLKQKNLDLRVIFGKEEILNKWKASVRDMLLLDAKSSVKPDLMSLYYIIYLFHNSSEVTQANIMQMCVFKERFPSSTLQF